MEKELGLIGFPLTHSFSPTWFENHFVQNQIKNFKYRLFPLERIEDLPALIKQNPDLQGLNVTIPYKKTVLPFLDELSHEVQAIGAANCIKILRDGTNVRTKGYNTDIVGFAKSLIPLLQAQHNQALVFGSGGAAQAVLYVLNEQSIEARVVSRRADTNSISYAELNPNLLKTFKLWINTTPVGMYPNVDKVLPIAYEHCSPQHLVYDLIYNPHETSFLKACKRHGAIIKNGYEMLEIQAEESAKIFRI
ncbi:MAG: shikimate dehydrogenase [Bacteroidia bacterium]|nr:shikimate dehydrogenase [Bacteroidia bacterium]